MHALAEGGAHGSEVRSRGKEIRAKRDAHGKRGGELTRRRGREGQERQEGDAHGAGGGGWRGGSGRGERRGRGSGGAPGPRRLQRRASGACLTVRQNSGSWLGKMRPPVTRARVFKRLIACMACVGFQTTPGG